MSRGRRAPAPRVAGDVLAAIAVGGSLGAVARYGLGHAWPTPEGAFPWSTFVINVAGCFAIGLLLVALSEGTGPPHRLARPFVGTGLLGGFTTFSAYAVEAERLLSVGATGIALTYVLSTLVAALLAAQAGVWAARAAVTGGRRARAANGSHVTRPGRRRRSR